MLGCFVSVIVFITNTEVGNKLASMVYRYKPADSARDSLIPHRRFSAYYVTLTPKQYHLS